MRGFRFLLSLLVVVAAWQSAWSHEVRPGYLELRQTAEENFDLTWKVPARGELRLAIYPRLPDGCRGLAPAATYATGGAFTDRWSVTVDELPIDPRHLQAFAYRGQILVFSVQEAAGVADVLLVRPPVEATSAGRAKVAADG